LFDISSNTAVTLIARAETIPFIAILPTADARRFRDIVKSGKLQPGQFATNSVSRGLDSRVPLTRVCWLFMVEVLQGEEKKIMEKKTD